MSFDDKTGDMFIFWSVVLQHRQDSVVKIRQMPKTGIAIFVI